MSIESEIKLALPVDQAAAARAFLTQLTGAAGQPLALSNTYFDTPDLALAKSRSALRLRHTPQGWLQTFKSGGDAQGGLHRRPEWELPVAAAALELDALLQACGAHPAAATLRTAAPRLAPLFQTNFTRTLWQLRDADAEIEIALDQGEVIAGFDAQLHAPQIDQQIVHPAATARRTAPLHELELELKRGDVAALHTLAQRLMAELPGLAADDISKAERGYALLGLPGPRG
jgi:inorganic triphosphatase YgiF